MGCRTLVWQGLRTERQLEVAPPTPAGPLIPDAVVLLANGTTAFVELDRGTMSYARLLAKLERYDAYRAAPPTGRGNAARSPRRHWRETYGGYCGDRPFPPLLFVFAPAPRRAGWSTVTKAGEPGCLAVMVG